MGGYKNCAFLLVKDSVFNSLVSVIIDLCWAVALASSKDRAFLSSGLAWRKTVILHDRNSQNSPGVSRLMWHES
jgi:hypothetical protein